MKGRKSRSALARTRMEQREAAARWVSCGFVVTASSRCVLTYGIALLSIRWSTDLAVTLPHHNPNKHSAAATPIPKFSFGFPDVLELVHYFT